MTFESKPKDEPQDFAPCTWTDRKFYESLNSAITKRLQAHKYEIRKDRRNFGVEVYLRHGSCRVVGDKHEGPHSIIEEYDAESLEEKAIQNICGFIYSHPFEPFRLEICLRFSSIRKKPESPNGDYRQMVAAEITSKTEATNFMDQLFLPRIDRDQLTSKVILDEILAQRYQNREEHERICNDILNRGASILFIAGVYCRGMMDIPSIVHLILDHNYNDANLPERGHHCGKPHCNENVKSLLRDLNAFFARKIERDGKLHELADNEVMPIMNIPVGEDKETLLGRGRYGTVTAVTIDPSHHYLTGVSGSLRSLRLG